MRFQHSWDGQFCVSFSWKTLTWLLLGQDQSDTFNFVKLLQFGYDISVLQLDYTEINHVASTWHLYSRHENVTMYLSDHKCTLASTPQLFIKILWSTDLRWKHNEATDFNQYKYRYFGINYNDHSISPGVLLSTRLIHMFKLHQL